MTVCEAACDWHTVTPRGPTSSYTRLVLVLLYYFFSASIRVVDVLSDFLRFLICYELIGPIHSSVLI